MKRLALYMVLLLLLGNCMLVRSATKDAKQIIVESPRWFLLHDGDRSEREQFIKSFANLATLPPDEIRAAMVETTEAWRAPVSTGNQAELKRKNELGSTGRTPWVDAFLLVLNLSIFNRFYFNVPPGAHKDQLWPLGVESDGTLFLAYPYRGSTGSVLDPVKEFDSFRRRYGLRKTPGRVDP